jgi:Family of unknown function (DUF5670)
MLARSACALEHRWIGADALRSVTFGKERNMLSTLVIVLVVLWLLGVVTAYTMGGFIHILLVIAVVVVLLRVIQGRSPLAG